MIIPYELRSHDFWIMALSVLSLMLFCAAAILIMMVNNHVSGLTYSEMLVKYSNPDAELYKHNPAHWTEEIKYYQEQLNDTMFPICCSQFPK